MDEVMIKEVYLYFYNKDTITPRELANLILNHDPRTEPLKYRDADYNKTLKRIQYHFETGANHDINTKDAFAWAMRKDWPNGPFNPAIEIPCYANLTGTMPVFTLEAVCLSSDPEQLTKDYLALMTEFKIAQQRIAALETEVARLKVFENRLITIKEKNRKGGEASKGVRKVFK